MEMYASDSTEWSFHQWTIVFWFLQPVHMQKSDNTTVLLRTLIKSLKMDSKPNSWIW